MLAVVPAGQEREAGQVTARRPVHRAVRRRRRVLRPADRDGSAVGAPGERRSAGRLIGTLQVIDPGTSRRRHSTPLANSAVPGCRRTARRRRPMRRVITPGLTAAFQGLKPRQPARAAGRPRHDRRPRPQTATAGHQHRGRKNGPQLTAETCRHTRGFDKIPASPKSGGHAVAACSMRPATAAGCQRQAEWLAATSVTAEPARWDIVRCAGGGSSRPGS
jgi:hypothetical protein